MNWLIYFFVFAFGSIIGSFLNVVILRHNTGESVISGGGSRCFNCLKKLRWHEMAPIFSFIAQKGKCRSCKSLISWQYPVVEIITGIIFLSIFNFQFSIFSEFSDFSIFKILYFWVLFSILIIIAVYDYYHQIIPDLFVWLFNGLTFLGLFGVFDFVRQLADWDLIGNFNWNGLIAGFVLFAFFASLWAVSRGRWMGFGDAKLALGLGWLLGMENGIIAILLSFWIGAAAGIYLLYFSKSKYGLKSAVAFGPFMILGAAIAYFFGSDLSVLIF